MPSERVQRQIDRLLDEAEAAMAAGDWGTVRLRAEAALALDSSNEDAATYATTAARELGEGSGVVSAEQSVRTSSHSVSLPLSFAGDRYHVVRLLGEGGRKRVYLAHDTRLDRDVAVAVIKTDGLDVTGRERVQREAQAMARLGDHPHIVTVFDVAEEDGRPLLVSQYMAGGSVEDLLAKAEDHRLPVADTLRIAEQVCQALDYAHARGVVHRDLKPGNVWLTGEGAPNEEQGTAAEREGGGRQPARSEALEGRQGVAGQAAMAPVTAKLGDFGLAVALDRSRMTMAGMMLGTVPYMPPEQALGGESTPKADLYSLGCMLYEMVTGRPPFVGDDPTAVISQHINTPPVAPSWLTEHCPPELEEVILRLLAKAPDDRPESATKVRQALLKVDPEKKSQSHSDSSENPLDRLARGVFVGRTKELERLRKAFDEAFAGRGGLVMLVGEPGIGKTRTTQELETYARMRGAQVLWGRTHESGGAPAYWPWYQAGNQFAAANDLATVIAPQLPPGAGAELSRIFPWLRQQPNFVEPEPITDPEAAQFRLFDAYASYVRAMSSQSPIVIALDDLHWADKPSLLLLQHLARELSRLRVLIVGNYRDTDITRQSALSETLAVLNRESGFERIVLRGLTRDETASYIRATANVEPRHEVLDRIFEETEGNAFFLSEVVNLMAQEGTLTRESVSDIRIPDGVKEALGRRLNRLSEETNKLLQVAAIVGREFAYDMLTLLGDRDEDSLLKLVEEALDARVIEELPQAGRYRFTHAQMQETLLEELSTTRRVRLHGQVGEALEKRWGARVDERASRLALHFTEAATLSARFAANAVRYGRLAAEQAEDAAAWSKAADFYGRCLALMEEAGDDFGEDRAALLHRRGRCAQHAADWRTAWRCLMTALDLYEDRRDPVGQAEVLLDALRTWMPVSTMRALWERTRPLLDDLRPDLQAALIATRLLIYPPVEETEEQDLEKRVSAILKEYPDPRIKALMLARSGQKAHWRGDFEAAAELARQAYIGLSRVGDRDGAARSLQSICSARMSAGELDDFERAALEMRDFTQEWHLRQLAGFASQFLAGIYLLRRDPRYEEALSQIPQENFFSDIYPAMEAEEAGDLRRAVELLPPVQKTGGAAGFLVIVLGHRTRILLAAGRAEEARSELEVWRSTLPEPGTRSSPTSRFPIDAYASAREAIATLAEPDLVRRVYDELAANPAFQLDIYGVSGIDVLRGALALHLGLVEDAQEHYRTGFEWATRERCPGEAGRCLQGLADVAERKGNVHEALQHIDRAIALFQQYGARLYLDQAVAMKVRLQGIGSAGGRSIDAVAESVQSEHPDLAPLAAPDGSVTIFVSDIEDSTALNERLGDERWLEVLREHNAIMRKHIAAHRGHEVKTIGDAFMVVFADPVEALQCAVDIQSDFAGWDKDPRIKVRVGLHAGEAVRDSDDFYGTNVTLAFRIAALGAGGQVLVSSVLKELTQSTGAFDFDNGREVELKGLSGKHPVYEVRWA
jgi:serine/threonine protein kinase/class 3 adenylate cyclase